MCRLESWNYNILVTIFIINFIKLWLIINIHLTFFTLVLVNLSYFRTKIHREWDRIFRKIPPND